MTGTVQSQNFQAETAPGNSPEQLAEVLAAAIDNPLLAAPESLRSSIVLFWQLIDEFLDSPKAIAFLFGHWISNCGLREDDALGILRAMSQPEELAGAKSKWDLLNRIANLASEAIRRRRQQAKSHEFKKQFQLAGEQSKLSPPNWDEIRGRLTQKETGAK